MPAFNRLQKVSFRWVLWALMPCSIAHAQSLADMYPLAQAHDGVYQAALSNSLATAAKADQARALLLPTANFTANLARNHASNYPEVGASNTRASTDSRLQVSASAPLYRPAAWASYAQGQVQSQTVPVIRLQAQQDLVMRLGQAYFDVLTAKTVVLTLEAQLKATEQQKKAAKRTFELGSSTVTDLREAQSRFDLVQANLIAAQNDLQQSKWTLSELIGLSSQQALQMHELKPDAALTLDSIAPLQQWVDLALAQSPAMRLAQSARDLAKEELTKSRAAHGPTLDATATYTRNQAHNRAVQASDVRANVANVGLLLSIPLFNGFATDAKVQESVALLEKAEQDLIALRRNTTQAVRSQYATLQSQVAQINALQAALTSSRSTLEANQLGYQVGVRINIDVLNAQSQLYGVERDLAKVRHQFLLGQLRLRQLAGQLGAADLTNLAALMKPQI